MFFLTAVEREVSSWCGRSIKNSSVKEVDGRLSVDDLEHLTEQQAQLLRCGLNNSTSRSELDDASVGNKGHIPTFHQVKEIRRTENPQQ